MLRSISLAALPLVAFTTFSLTGCAGSSTDDELAGESTDDAALDGKADSPEGAYTYYKIVRDVRSCSSPTCGGFFLSRVNRTTTTCHTGSSAARCYTPVLDWSEAGLPQAAQDQLVAAAGKAPSSSGAYALVRGRFAKKNTTTPRPELGKFIVTEAWVAAGDNVSEGVFAKVKQNGVRCIAEPCPSLTEKGLNSSNRIDIADLDWTGAELSETAVQGFVDELTTPSGIIVAGDRYTFKISGRSGKGRTVSNAYHQLTRPPAPCFVGGCSGQICSEHEGVISTCEWRPEYACYQEASCARQADGACGWTETPELTTCLAGH